MAARAIWKGVIRLGDASVPVKLFSAVEDRGVHFRLLHEKDLVPVKQAMVNSQTDEVVPYEQVRKGYVTEEGQIVVLESSDLGELEPEESRDIRITRFLPQAAIDHLWYDRPYYLGPDGGTGSYFALVEALRKSGKEGLAHWVMRKKEYAGALRLQGDHPVLITLRHADEVAVAEDLKPPSGRDLDKKELAMAGQLMSMLEEKFDPTEYRDEYRQRVLDLIESKAAGRTVKFRKAKRKKPAEDLGKALRASIKKERKVA
ncbi:MAG: Ku protein [Gammaproteobacteria bacterium]|nr:Ku protein [Gammaproteobacteria bacterium]